MSGNEIKEKRNKLKLTREDFADQLGVSTKLVQNWETGKTTPADKYIPQLKLVFAMNSPDEEIEEITNAMSEGAQFNGYALKRYREKKRLTQKELGDKLQVSEQQIQSWEYEIRKPKFENVVKLANALGIATKRLYI